MNNNHLPEPPKDAEKTFIHLELTGPKGQESVKSSWWGTKQDLVNMLCSAMDSDPKFMNAVTSAIIVLDKAIQEIKKKKIIV